MSDPLSPTVTFGRMVNPIQPPPWPSSPHQPADLPAHLSPSSSTSRSFSQQQSYRPQQENAHQPPSLQRNRPSSNSISNHSSGFEKERQVYGQPSQSLMSPDALMDGKRADRLSPFLRVKITGMERNRKDLLIRFDASTNLSHFNRNLYKNMQRSYVEFRLFADQLAIGNPQTIVAALPLPQSSAVTDEEDDRLVRIALQRWFSHVCEDTVLLQDEELRSFIESDFGYNPVPRARRKAPSTFPIQLPLLGKGPHDEDKELATAKSEIAKLDTQFAEAAKASDKLSKSRKNLAASEVDFGTKLVTSATTEQVPSLSAALRKLGRAMDAIAGIQHVQAVNESVVIGDTLGYQSLNARSARETLSQRTILLEECSTAAKITITKRRAVERMKGSSSIASSKVDDAIAELNEAKEAEEVISTRLDNISKNLHRSLQTHSRQAHEDIAVALLEHARMNVLCERSILKELEALRSDISGISNTGSRKTAVSIGGGLPSTTAPSSSNVNKALPVPDRQSLPPTRSWVEQPKPVPSGSAPSFSSPQSGSTGHPSLGPSGMHPNYPQAQASVYAGNNPSYHSSRPLMYNNNNSTNSTSFVAPPRNGTTQSAFYSNPNLNPASSSRSGGGPGGGADPLSGGNGQVYSSANPNPRLEDRGTGGSAIGGQGITQSFYQPSYNRPGVGAGPGGIPPRRKLDPREAARQLANGF
ncbi:Membrane coat complex Retromer, subunit VPS5/SNX1, Sorting nexins, and related PX domain-containing proteins [Phaffia rhodozyma]|uniref:Membrane coat complex Retromer, subunit VPS5/SNX1, Sorting nexins, and related PX domain-containing proteins n=1 Tax=Phaffia rhodozyma TaxID=264483 RepID=A0A0F7SJ68_PHARH|nr:Membrane coat complex Retromer, subunit VPS5/SNX1, Sorting nexins, and related PX domain-containing proteins [Phaffia rhodozyma]